MAEIRPTHHAEDDPGTFTIALQVGTKVQAVKLPKRSIAETGEDLRKILNVRAGDDLFGVPTGYLEDFRVELTDVVCLLCTDHFYTFPREVNGG